MSELLTALNEYIKASDNLRDIASKIDKAKNERAAAHRRVYDLAFPESRADNASAITERHLIARFDGEVKLVTIDYYNNQNIIFAPVDIEMIENVDQS